MAKVVNVHERELHAPPDQIGALIDSLSSKEDVLWPNQCWPRMSFDRALGVGAAGGHGPVRYFVEQYTRGASIRFRFSGPRGFNGYHGYELVRAGKQSVVLQHRLEMTTHGWAALSWPLVFRPLHDALIEDSLATAEVSLGQPPRVEVWSPWVRWLRWLMDSRGAAKARAFR